VLLFVPTMVLTGLRTSLTVLALFVAVAPAALLPSEPVRLVAWGTLLLVCTSADKSQGRGPLEFRPPTVAPPAFNRLYGRRCALTVHICAP